MERIPVPDRALTRYVRKNLWLRGLFAVLFFAAWCAFAVIFNAARKTYPSSMRLEGVRFLIWIGVGFLLTVVLFHLWRYLTDRTLCGVIESSRLTRGYTADEDAGTARGLRRDERIRLRVKIRDKAGRAHYLKFEQKDGSYLYYENGAEVIRFRGLPYPIRPDEDAETGFVCVACGRIVPAKSDACENCGLPLIDPSDLPPV